MSASADVLALSQLEVELQDIEEGSNAVMKWQGKPIFVRHRTQQEIDSERGVDLADLKDPEGDVDRVKKDQWLVVLGICTHLGCVPMSHAGEFNGYFSRSHRTSSWLRTSWWSDNATSAERAHHTLKKHQ